MLKVNYNPDVLSCLANLSNDEVFTPPKLVNEILDLLPVEIWSDKSIAFIDPFTKSGVFLREIAKRLMEGLKTEIPDQQQRINHIFKNQLYGIAITELTSLLARRSVYCSKTANSKYSIVEGFDNEHGNIKFDRIEHTWQNGKCTFCGVKKDAYDRGKELETYAYEFIHTDEPQKIFNMKFDVIVGNPPYQLGSDGGTRDIPIYNKFIENAKQMNPRYLSMIIPSRWMAGGLGLKSFRREMLADRRIRELVDYPVANEVFNGVEIKGGVCYFLWDRDNEGSCKVTRIRGSEKIISDDRNLNEYDVFVRDGRALKILNKVLSFNEESIIDVLSVDKEFGWTSNFADFSKTKIKNGVPLYYIKKGKRYNGWIGRNKVLKSSHLIDKWKVMIPKAGSDGGKKIPDRVLGKTQITPSPSVCTQSFLFFYVDTENDAISIEKYIKTRFFRFLVSLRKITQDATKSTYKWVPMQRWNADISDEYLFEKYNFTQEEKNFIVDHITEM